MAELQMPATEATPAIAHEDERNCYELAFHVLPTVAEGEVPGVFAEIKAHITEAGGELSLEETPERIDLAYEITKSVEGKHRKFASAYFGWVRFKVGAEAIEVLTEAIDARTEILRYLVIKLTKLEEESPFKFHENRKSVKMVEVVSEEPERITETQTEVEEAAEVSTEELDESLEKITNEGEKSDEEKKKA